MKKKILIMALLSCCIIAFLGCAAMQKKEKTETPTGLESQASLKFADVPVPMGFKLLSQESYNFESGGIRVGVLKYQGKANIDRVVSFYKEQMPMYNWNLLNVTEYGQRLLNFDRDTETCIISLLPKGNNIAMTISLGPKSAIRKKAEKPIK